MNTPSLAPNRRRQSGQVALLVPFLVLFLAVACFISLDIGTLVEDRMRVQISADSASRAGARTQAMALGTMTILNDVIIVGQILFIRAVGELLDPETWVQAIEDGVHGYQLISRAMQIQDKIMNCELVPICVTAAVVDEMLLNDTDSLAFPIPIGVYVPKLGGSLFLNLQLERNWTLCMVRSGVSGAVGEFVGVVGFKWKSSETFWLPKLLGQDLDYPTMWVLSSANPYYTGVFYGRDPKDDVLNPVEQFVSMRIPGPFWDAKQTNFWSEAFGDVGGFFLDVGLSKIADSIIDAIKTKFSIKQAAGQKSSCFSSPEQGAGQISEESEDIEMTSMEDFDE